MVDTATLKKEISNFLSGADLNAITSKKVRKELENRLSTDLSSRKAEINDLIADVLRAGESEKAEETGEADGNSSDSSLSDLDDSPRRRPPAKPTSKAKAATSKAPTAGSNGGDAAGSSSSDDDVVDAGADSLTDEQLARRLHERENRLPRRRAAAAAAGPRAKRRRSDATSAGGGKRRDAGGFSKPCALSDTLAEVVGCESMPRQQVVKRLWEIAKERDMFDPKNKQFILCDAQFERLFGKKRVRMFGAMKYLKSHIRPIEDE